MADLIVGAWREGLSDTAREFVKLMEGREDTRFRETAYDGPIGQLISLLDGYDAIAEELLTEGDA